MATIIITEFMDDAAVARLSARHDTLYDPKLVDDPGRLALLLPEARALIVRNRTQVRGALLESGRKLEVVGRLGVGLDNIDVTACAEHGISVIPATGANDLSVAEWVITSAMILLRGAYHMAAQPVDGARTLRPDHGARRLRIDCAGSCQARPCARDGCDGA